MCGKVRSSYSVLSPRHSVLLRGIFLLHFPSDCSALALPGTVALRSSDFPHPAPRGHRRGRHGRRCRYYHMHVGPLLEHPMTHDVLAPIPLFAKLPVQERAELAGMLQSKQFAAHQPVVWLGEQGDDFYIVHTGKVAVSCPDEAGKEVTRSEERRVG